ncbi:hypothetical protein GCM10010116_61660 [Microbispora rosea subsp. aerata]|nr:hypothetical protein GCM10010116_61660 [Microbispora rosea subsp. aerata]
MNDFLDEPDRWHSAHVPIRRGHFRKLEWWKPSPAPRVLVLAWTCDCQARFYELCEALRVGWRLYGLTPATGWGWC